VLFAPSLKDARAGRFPGDDALWVSPMANDERFESQRVMPPRLFRERNRMSKSEYYRRRQRQRAGEPGAENLLPLHIRLSEHREGIRFCDEAAWQQARLVNAVATGRRKRAQAAA